MVIFEMLIMAWLVCVLIVLPFKRLPPREGEPPPLPRRRTRPMPSWWYE